MRAVANANQKRVPVGLQRAITAIKVIAKYMDAAQNLIIAHTISSKW
jgi:hypothetical protein